MGDSFDLGKAGTLDTGAEIALPDAQQAGGPPSPYGDPSSPLLVPDPPAPLDADQAIASVRLSRETITKLDVMSAGFIVAIIQLGPRDRQLRARVGDIDVMGAKDLEAVSGAVGRILESPVGSLSRGGAATSREVGETLLNLRRQLDDLNPGHQGDLFGARRILGLFPVGDRLHSYFAKYQTAQTHLNDIISSLLSEERALADDNAVLERAKADLGPTVGRLRQYLYMAHRIEANLADRVSRTEATDAGRATALRVSLLLPVEKREIDLATGLAVAVQAYASIDAIRRNSSEMIKGLDRIVAATTSALQGAIEAAQNVAEYRLVLDQIVALTGMPTDTGLTTGVMDIPKLQAAFDAVYTAIDELDAWRTGSADSMTKTASAIELLRAQPVA